MVAKALSDCKAVMQTPAEPAHVPAVPAAGKAPGAWGTVLQRSNPATSAPELPAAS